MRSASIGVVLAFPVFLGPAASQRILATRLGNHGSEFGSAVAAAGDVNRDGVGDLLVSSPEFPEQGQRPPTVSILSGVDLGVLRVITGGLNEDWGVSIDGGQDFDGDQVPDIVIGVPRRVRASLIVGAAEVRSGATGAVLATYSPDGSGTRGYAVATLPDVDRDGVPDFAVSDSDGRIHIVSGRTRVPIRVAILPSINFNPVLLRAAGDVDRDGTVDLVWGSDRSDGWAGVVSGATGARLFLMSGTPTGGVGDVAGCGDVDGDGNDDFAISAHYSQRQSGALGVVEVYSGRTGTRLYEIEPALPGNTFFGKAMAVIDDWNGDGARDLAITMQATWLANRHAAVIHSGRDGRLLGVFDAATASEGLAATVAGVGDTDGDGLGDLAIANPFDSSFLYRQGAARILSSRILAQSIPAGQPCGGGPALPTLLASRPVLGASFTLQGRNVYAPGVVLLGFSTNRPFNLGVPGCDLHIDPASLVELHRVTLAQDWSLPVPLPDVALLVGLEVALQASYAPTVGPLGADISNAVRLRLGR